VQYFQDHHNQPNRNRNMHKELLVRLTILLSNLWYNKFTLFRFESFEQTFFEFVAYFIITYKATFTCVLTRDCTTSHCCRTYTTVNLSSYSNKVIFYLNRAILGSRVCVFACKEQSILKGLFFFLSTYLPISTHA